jgi:DNA-directed RNA polymerase subunit beta
MQSLGLNVEVLSEAGEEIELKEVEEDIAKTAEKLGFDLGGQLTKDEEKKEAIGLLDEETPDVEPKEKYAEEAAE